MEMFITDKITSAIFEVSLPKMVVPLRKLDKILSLWKGREDKEICFTKIKERMESISPRWYERKVVRYLNRMVGLGLLKKRRKGKYRYYKATSKIHEYEVSSFFDRVREASQKKGWVIREKDSMLVYGIPLKNRLLPLEKEILSQVLHRIHKSFYDLYLLKKSIMARNEVSQPTDYDLVMNYLLEKTAELFRRQLWDEVYRAESENEIANLISFAKRKGIEIEESDRFIEIEKKWMSPFASKYPYHPWSSFEEACLAVITMLSPNLIKEYALDSYNYLKETIEKLEKENVPFTDRSLVVVARDFLKREKLRAKPHVLERILALRRWPWLRFKLGSETTDKLVKIICYLWKMKKKAPKTRKKLDIHVMSEEEADKELKRILRESQKIRFSRLIDDRSIRT